MAANAFRIPKYVDHIIQNSEGLVVGTLRIKPSGIGWAKAEGKKWRMVKLDKLVQFIEENGKLIEK